MSFVFDAINIELGTFQCQTLWSDEVNKNCELEFFNLISWSLIFAFNWKRCHLVYSLFLINLDVIVIFPSLHSQLINRRTHN
jgi:hypothetical protein